MLPITILERNILELLNNSTFSLKEVSEKTGYDKHLCLKIMRDLIDKKLVIFDGIKFSTASSIPEETIKIINSPEVILSETMEYIETIIENKNSNLFKFKKITLSESDEIIFNAMLVNLEIFLKNSHLKKSASKDMRNQKVVFWGMGKMDSISKQMIGEIK